MGVVWQGEDRVLGRPVAVKEIAVAELGGPDDDRRRRALREARAAARVMHPGLVAMFDVVEEPGRILLVEEWIDAPTLRDLVAERGPLDPTAAVSMARQLLDALAVLHAAGIVHRDVKPSNVMIVEGGRVKLADFGVATLAGDPEITATGAVLGSPGYLSPEQAQGVRVGPAADVWSLGATLWFSVEGRAPYEGSGLAALGSIVNDPVPTATRAGPLAELLDAALRKDPDERASVDELRALLRERTVVAGAAPLRSTAALDEPIVDDLPDVASEPQPFVPAAATAVDLPPAVAPAAVTAIDASPVTPAVTAVDRPTAVAAAGPTAVGLGRPRRATAVLVPIAAVVLLVGVVVAALAARNDDRGTAGDAASTAAPSTSPAPAAALTPEGERPAAAPPEKSTSSATATDAVELPPGWKVHRDDTARYAAGHPASWRIRRVDGTRTDLVDPATGTYLRVDWTSSPGPSAVQAWRDQSAAFGSRREGYREIRIEETTFRGRPAAIWEYTYRQGGATLHGIDLGFTTEDRGYALNLQTSEERWASSQDLWRQLQAAFDFEN